MKQGMQRISLITMACMLAALLATGCSTTTMEATSASTSAANQTPFTGSLILSADEAVAKQGSDQVIFVDCTGEVGSIEGAASLTWQDLSTCSTEYGEASDEGWGKIPEAADLAKRLGDFGLDKSKEIVLLGHTTTGWGEDGRIAWTLRAAGYQDVKLVDGGIDAFVAAGAKTQAGGGAAPASCTVEVDAIDKTHVADTDTLLADLASYKIVDTRALEEYEGATFYGEKKGGHIPGAVHIGYLDLFKEDGTLKSNDEITAIFENAGIAKTDQVVTYCTGGIRSAYVQMVLEMCGFEHTMNYDQSYWRWCAVGDVE